MAIKKIYRYDVLTDCRTCPDLGKDHVEPIGPVPADVMIIGQSPGRYEVEQNEPFVGASGTLVNRLLTECYLSRSEVYITNVVKCRPPNNRASSYREQRWCYLQWLKDEIKHVKPKVLLMLGHDAHRAVFRGRSDSTGKYLIPFKHGIHRRTKKRSYITSYHPAYFLRSGDGDEFVKVGRRVCMELDYWIGEKEKERDRG